MHITPVANLTCFAFPKTIFTSAKSFIGTLEIQIIFFLKDKLNCNIKTMHGFHGNRYRDS